MVSEIFNASFLFSIALIIAAVGGLYLYFNRKFLEQNHKMQSMLELISTIAEEMQYFRSKITCGPVENNDNANNANTSNNANNANKKQIISNFLGGNENIDADLIAVSDSEVDEDDSDSEEEDDSDSESEEDEYEVDDLEVDDFETDDTNDLNVTKIINIDLGIDENNEETDFNIESEDIEMELENSINLESSNLEDIDVSLKSISIDGSNVATNKTKDDYKKMALNKLREAVLEKGLVSDASKLKKNELLKLLGAE